MGVRVEINNGNTGGFVHIDEGGNAWSLLEDGSVMAIAEGPEASTYIMFSEPVSLRRYAADGQVMWSINYDAANSPIQLNEGQHVQMKTLEGGDLILHTKEVVPQEQCPRPDGAPEDYEPEECFNHYVHRVSANGQETGGTKCGAIQGNCMCVAITLSTPSTAMVSGCRRWRWPRRS